MAPRERWAVELGEDVAGGPPRFDEVERRTQQEFSDVIAAARVSRLIPHRTPVSARSSHSNLINRARST
ncbi:MAG: hypothetical protein ABSB52_16010 [Acidimicrobiales bacterium]